MKTLNLYPASEIKELAWPEDRLDLTLSSSALHFFTDFKDVKPLVIDSSISALEVKRLMEKAHVRLKFVISQKDDFMGIISSEDLHERKIVQRVSEGSKRTDIALTDLMTPKRDLKALDYEEVAHAPISAVINKLRDCGEQHCLVIDHDTHQIRGIFSASDISRKLHLPINIQDKSSFYKVFSATA